MNGYLLNFRVNDVGGPVASGSLYRTIGDADFRCNDLAEFTATTRGNPVLVLLHGYNNDYSEGRKSLMRYMAMLDRGGFSGVMLATLWPGDGWAKALT